jgi:lipooligosaccharide transport system permease protein
LQPVAQATPLYHGVELCRGAALHTLGVAAAAVHVAVLLAFWFVGLWCSSRIFARRLAE